MTDWWAELAKLGPFIITTLLVHGPWSPLFPAAFEPMLLAFGKLYPPLLIAVLGAVLSVAMEWVNYRLYDWMSELKRLEALKARAASGRLVRLFARQPFLATWLFALSPAPDWGARVLAILARYSIRRYLLAFLLGRVPKFWLLATIGEALPVEGGTLFVAAIVLTVGLLSFGLWRHANRPPGIRG